MPDVLLHEVGVAYTLTNNGVYVLAPPQRVASEPFQPPALWPLLEPLQVFWDWPSLRVLWAAEDRARKAEARRSAAHRRGITVMVDGAPLVEPIRPRFPKGADPVMLAWRHRVRERALAEEPIRVEYGLDALTSAGYRTRLIGAWTRLPRTDLHLAVEGRERGSMEAALLEARAIEMRLRRAGRTPVVLEAEAI